jgi:hypothetical protein
LRLPSEDGTQQENGRHGSCNDDNELIHSRLLSIARHSSLLRPAEDHLHPVRGQPAAPYLYGRPQLASRTRAVLCGLFDRPLGG